LRGWSDRPAKAAELGVRGRAHVLAHYGRDANCRAIETIIERYWGAR
ncbi:MAG: hypothetical protein JJD97_06600, partial [Gemmatimonadaceae bacterium]|nr:hypothetical protein [Gemmatimonadaceae bacterium]